MEAEKQRKKQTDRPIKTERCIKQTEADGWIEAGREKTEIARKPELTNREVETAVQTVLTKQTASEILADRDK